MTDYYKELNALGQKFPMVCNACSSTMHYSGIWPEGSFDEIKPGMAIRYAWNCEHCKLVHKDGKGPYPLYVRMPITPEIYKLAGVEVE